MPYRVPFIRPVFPDGSEIASDFDAIVGSNWYTNFGPKEREFGRAISERIGGGVRVVTFANATLALMAAVQTLLGRGDGRRLVIVPSFTFAAGPAAIAWAGYQPRFIDIDDASLQPSLDSAREVLENSTLDVAGILLCNTFGIGNPEIALWEGLASEFGLPLIVDSAAGFGSMYTPDAAVGTAGALEVFSFHATKPFAVGEGGAIATRDEALAVLLKEFQNFGFHAGMGSTMLGLNGKLQEINAAIGLRQLARFDGVLASRRRVLDVYREGFEETQITMPTNIELSSVCFASAVLPGQPSRDQAVEDLLAQGVEARTYYSPAVHRQPHFLSYASESSLPVTDRIVSRVLSLPVHEDMPTVVAQQIVRVVRTAVGA